MSKYLGILSVMWFCTLGLVPIAIFGKCIGDKNGAKKSFFLWLYSLGIMLSALLFSFVFDHF